MFLCMCHLDDILKKSPEVDDVFGLIKEHSAKWNDLAIALKIDENTRTTLRNETQLTDDSKLDSILQNWHQAQPSDVTWEKILEVLESTKLRITGGEVKKFLEKPNVIEKHRKKPDFDTFGIEKTKSEADDTMEHVEKLIVEMENSQIKQNEELQKTNGKSDPVIKHSLIY